jgi:hypothetical protein
MELPMIEAGSLCGALSSGIVCIGLLCGRRLTTGDLPCVDELSHELPSYRKQGKEKEVIIDELQQRATDLGRKEVVKGS